MRDRYSAPLAHPMGASPAQRSGRSPRILMLNQYYPPGASATAVVLRDLAQRLAGSVGVVKVLAGRPSYDSLESCRWVPLRRERDGPIAVERVGSTGLDRRRMTGRVANYLSFLALAAARGLLAARSDVVIVGSDPPLAVWAAILAARRRPVIYSLRDLHPDHAIVSSMIQEGLATRLWDAAHRAALERCDVVVCLGEAMAEGVRRKGVLPERIVVIPDGAWLPEGAPDPGLVEELRAGAAFVAAHAGNIGGAGAWETLVEAARLLEGQADLLFVGDGSFAGVVRNSCVRVVPFRPASEIPSVMAAGDLQVVSIRSGMERAVVPSKVYTALAYGRPLLAVASEKSDVAGIVRTWGCGLVASPNSPEDVAEKVRWAREHPAALTEMAAGSAEAGRHFERGRQLGHLADLVGAVAARSPRCRAGSRGRPYGHAGEAAPVPQWAGHAVPVPDRHGSGRR